MKITLKNCLHGMNRKLATGFAIALFAFGTAGAANAQYGGYDPYGRNDRYERRDDRYGRNNNRNSNRALSDAIKRIEKNSNAFNDRLDGALDRSRYNGSRREDRIDELSGQFEDTADELEERFANGNGNRFNESRATAQRLVQLGSRLDRFVSNNRLDGRVESLWFSIRRDLDYVGNAFGVRRGYDNNGSYDPYGNDRGNDRYDPRYPNNNRRDRYEPRDNRRRTRAGDIIGGILGYPNN